MDDHRFLCLCGGGGGAVYLEKSEEIQDPPGQGEQVVRRKGGMRHSRGSGCQNRQKKEEEYDLPQDVSQSGICGKSCCREETKYDAAGRQ